ncbi:MAG: hypothetical protein ACR2GB_05635, partial [Nocardioidaceae bacterium]
DDTAAVAAKYEGVRVLSTPIASKREALRLGDEHATSFPRVYVDADVVTHVGTIRHLVEVLASDSLLATAPRRVVPRDGVGWPVRWYYDVWERLPNVASGLFGRGVIAVSDRGYRRLRSLPPVMSDDLAFSEAFRSGERAIVNAATVIVRPPRTLRDLLRRRMRVVTGNAQADGEKLRGPSARTKMSDLSRIAVASPGFIPKVLWFVGVTVAARIGAAGAIRRGDFDTWLRDESSRSGTGAQ